jgi:hypothetical protein
MYLDIVASIGFYGVFDRLVKDGDPRTGIHL